MARVIDPPSAPSSPSADAPPFDAPPLDRVPLVVPPAAIGARWPIVIVGATATGKSDLALALAEALDGEIVNADALQVYRGFDIGTAKPNAAMRARVPHHLIDICAPTEPYSAGRFADEARAAIAAIRARGRWPLVVGGSGLYVRALLEGIRPLPPADAAVRARLDARLADEGLPALHAELTRSDPATAARLAPADRQRILRALEVLETSGRPLSEQLRETPFGVTRLPAIRLGLTLPRQLLYDRISFRVGRMMHAGWLEEIRRLLRQGVPTDAPAFQAIGYRQLFAHLAGHGTLDAALDDIIRATRRYAKRQRTWFRKEKDIRWLSAAAISDHIQPLLRVLGGSTRP
ncbi:MAG: tRNA (adenosine(37)-N6)-dimethylallyltransferase MiaA [Acidobacteriota bacterium]